MAKMAMEAAQYEFVGWHKHHGAVFRDAGTGRLEQWEVNDGHAEFGFHYSGHDWKFVSWVTMADVQEAPA